MQPFKLPDFYVPWPARLNPNLETARAHSKTWAQEMGILGGSDGEDCLQIWSEREFDRHDYALFCSYIHPETPSPELNLMTDWNVWAFYVDDYFLKVYKRPKDHDGAKKYLDRVLLFMPLDLSPSPAPTSPTESGLADLWIRTAPTKSEAWRSRIVESTKSLLEASIRELDNMSHQRLANPIEYIDMRRRVGGAMWSADLVEHATFIEIPERIAATRPMRLLKDTFADAVHLRNDIFSYEREVLKEGELTNAVLVMERFLDVETQKAVNLVNDLLTSRLQQFEHTVCTELEPMFDEYNVDPLERTDVLTYIRGLQDWQSGGHEWHVKTSRYLNPDISQASTVENLPFGLSGLGTSAARIIPNAILGLKRFKNYAHTPYQKVEPTTLFEFYMPFTTRMNSNLGAARQHSKVWAREMGMLEVVAGNPNVFVWDDNRFDAADVAFFCGMAYPNATANQIDLAAYWLTWATYTDDFFAAVYGHTHDLAGAKIAYARLGQFMPIDGAASTEPESLTPVERGLSNVWMRTVEILPVEARSLLRESIDELIKSWLWEIGNRIQNRIPDLIDYVEMRRKTSGEDFMLAFIRCVQGQGIPPEIHATQTMQELNRAAGDHVYLINDLVSYQKEIEFEGDIHNSLLVVQNFMGCSRRQSAEIINNLMTARLKQFEHIAKMELPILFETFALDTKAREQLLAHVHELERLMSASLQWHIKVNRYKEVDLRRITRTKPPTTTRPGLGISATHILNVIGHTAHPQQISSLPQVKEELDAQKLKKTFVISHPHPPFIKKKEEV
jgi:germacradienol/geosmin synthase